MKISITYNLTQEEWKELTEQEHPITQYIDDTVDGIDLVVKMTKGGLTTKSQTSVPTKTATQIANEEAAAKQLEKERKETEKAEKKRIDDIKVIFENSSSMEEVFQKVKKESISAKRAELNGFNKNKEFLKEELPPKPLKFSMTLEDMKPLVLAEYKAILETKVTKNSFPSNSWQDIVGQNILRNITAKLAGDKQYNDSHVEEVLSILCNFLDPKNNPQRGEMNDECYITERDVHEYTSDWAQYVLANELNHL